MLTALQVVTLILVALAMVTAVAHALELPGKMRLSKDEYLTVQRIYYPGFAIAGLAEGFSMVAAFALVLRTPTESTSFALSLAALVLLVLMHAVYWVVTAPVNKVWLRGQQLSKAGTTFFRMNAGDEVAPGSEWTALRNRWEYSHAVRAVLVTGAFALLVSVLAMT